MVHATAIDVARPIESRGHGCTAVDVAAHGSRGLRPTRSDGFDGTGPRAPTIDLRSPLTVRNAFLFPLQTAASRAEVALGGVLLLLPFVGWLLNMGHRIQMVHAMQEGRTPWPAWRTWRRLLRHGLVTWVGMVCYYTPALLTAWAGARTGSAVFATVAVVLFVLATVAIPGYMTHYCRRFELREIFDPFRALRRSVQGGRMYWRAWAISLLALALSFLGLLVLGVGFLFTSVWFWQVAGYAFANVFTNRFALAPGDGR